MTGGAPPWSSDVQPEPRTEAPDGEVPERKGEPPTRRVSDPDFEHALRLQMVIITGE